MDSRNLSPAETAKALGITRRALRVYEQHGLIHPLKSSNGYRAYGPDALIRLHQILTLKRLGFTLASMHGLLSGPLARLDDVLELQEMELAKRRIDAERGLAVVRAARARLAIGDILTLDDLITLTKETTMADTPPRMGSENAALHRPQLELGRQVRDGRSGWRLRSGQGPGRMGSTHRRGQMPGWDRSRFTGGD